MTSNHQKQSINNTLSVLSSSDPSQSDTLPKANAIRAPTDQRPFQEPNLPDDHVVEAATLNAGTPEKYVACMSDTSPTSCLPLIPLNLNSAKNKLFNVNQSQAPSLATLPSTQDNKVYHCN